MSVYVITNDFIELKRLYEQGNIDKFEKKIDHIPLMIYGNLLHTFL